MRKIFFLVRRVEEGVGGVMYGNTTNNRFPHFYTSSMYTNHPFIQYTIRGWWSDCTGIQLIIDSHTFIHHLCTQTTPSYSTL